MDCSANRIRELQEDTERQSEVHEKKLAELVAKGQAAAAQTGVSEHQRLFKLQAEEHRLAAIQWLRASVALLTGCAVGAAIYFAIPPKCPWNF
jgi:hypothetical protein